MESQIYSVKVEDGKAKVLTTENSQDNEKNPFAEDSKNSEGNEMEKEGGDDEKYQT